MMEEQEKKEKLGRAVRDLIDALNIRVAEAKQLGLRIELETPTKLKGLDADEHKYRVRILEEIDY